MADLSEDVEALQNALVVRATGGGCDDNEYRRLRSQIIDHPLLKDVAPRFLRTCRSTPEFWQFIKFKYGSYAERRKFIWEEFRPMFERLEGATATPADQPVSAVLERFDATTVHATWQKALDRRETDPEGAITMARTLLESVCKHILDDCEVAYSPKADLPALYKATAEVLNIAPSQHTEPIFKQILGGCVGVIEGLGALRNRLSDAHGRGKMAARPAPRHAELAVNLAGTVAMFLIATHARRRSDTQ